ncbi:MAG: hypothetical protein KDB27_10190, partial [Planctomycetales bacterium]|nr:hypothetical protein [Planctomycetales bacterium]
MSLMLNKSTFRNLLGAIVLVACVAGSTNAADIFYIQRNDDPSDEGDDAQIEFLEGLGHTLDIWGNDSANADPDGAFEAAEEADLVWINESVSSGRVGIFSDTETPIINNENFACDTLGWSEEGIRSNEGHGSPGTIRDNLEGEP